MAMWPCHNFTEKETIRNLWTLHPVWTPQNRVGHGLMDGQTVMVSPRLMERRRTSKSLVSSTSDDKPREYLEILLGKKFQKNWSWNMLKHFRSNLNSYHDTLATTSWPSWNTWECKGQTSRRLPKSRRDFENLQRSSLGEKGSQHDFQAQRCFHKSLSNHILGFRNCIILHLGIIPSVGMTACCGALGRQDGLEDGRVALRTWGQTSELELGKLLCRQLTPAANPVEEPARRFRPCTREFNRSGRCWKYLSSVCRVFVHQMHLWAFPSAKFIANSNSTTHLQKRNTHHSSSRLGPVVGAVWIERRLQELGL
jgi:hypothetical protein